MSRLQLDTKRSESHFYFYLSLHQNKENPTAFVTASDARGWLMLDVVGKGVCLRCLKETSKEAGVSLNLPRLNTSKDS